MKTMERVGIVGYGYVGKAIEKFFGDHFKLFIYDPPYMDANDMGDQLNDGGIVFTRDKDNINSCDLVVVCVPTPSSDDGEVDLSIIDETFEWLNAPLILIKSTVPPGTTEQLVKGERTGKWIDRRIAFSPEYIGEGNYEVPFWKGYPHPTDMKKHSFHIFGGEKKATTEIIPFFLKVAGPDSKYIQTNARSAELTKYMFNSWGATKVTFCNEFANIAEVMDVDYNELRELLLLDKRMEPMHTAIFGNKRGFGGKCFPKDVRGVIHSSTEAGYTPNLLKQVLKSNKEFRKE